MGTGTLPVFGTDHNVAHSLYDRQSACYIPFDHCIPVSGIPALGKKAGGTVW